MCRIPPGTNFSLALSHSTSLTVWLNRSWQLMLTSAPSKSYNFVAFSSILKLFTDLFNSLTWALWVSEWQKTCLLEHWAICPHENLAYLHSISKILGIQKSLLVSLAATCLTIWPKYHANSKTSSCLLSKKLLFKNKITQK